jgi:hypothetical protein
MYCVLWCWRGHKLYPAQRRGTSDCIQEDLCLLQVINRILSWQISQLSATKNINLFYSYSRHDLIFNMFLPYRQIIYIYLQKDSNLSDIIEFFFHTQLLLTKICLLTQNNILQNIAKAEATKYSNHDTWTELAASWAPHLLHWLVPTQHSITCKNCLQEQHEFPILNSILYLINICSYTKPLHFTNSTHYICN